VTVIVEVPVVAVAEAARVRVLVHVVPEGVQLVGLNEPVTPVGRPLTVKLTGCPAAVPTRVA